ncbi:MAG: hypothetical protein JSS56_12615 [Proteobacteria bacterium]|nr:hypothetical protein [Pseudomonadota bacterium]
MIYTPGAGNRPPQILVKGELVQADVEAFTTAAQTARTTPGGGAGHVNVVIDSRGGNIWAAMTIGRIIRKNAFMTRVERGASCVSACVYLLAAGEGRYVGGRVGIHRPYIPNDGVTSARAKKAQYDGINMQSRQYLEEMGVSAALHDQMMQTPPDRVTWLSEHDMATFGLTKMVAPPPRPAPANQHSRDATPSGQ